MNDYVSGPKFTTKPLLREIFLNLHVFTRMLFSFLLVSEFVAWYIVVKTLPWEWFAFLFVLFNSVSIAAAI